MVPHRCPGGARTRACLMNPERRELDPNNTRRMLTIRPLLRSRKTFLEGLDPLKGIHQTDPSPDPPTANKLCHFSLRSLESFLEGHPCGARLLTQHHVGRGFVSVSVLGQSPRSRFVRAILSVSSTIESSSSRPGVSHSQYSPSRQMAVNRSGSRRNSTQAGLLFGGTMLGRLQITRQRSKHVISASNSPGSAVATSVWGWCSRMAFANAL